MKYITIESAMFLAGAANMLSLYGIETTDAVIAKGMEAPFFS